MAKSSIFKYKNDSLMYQPVHDAINRIDKVAKSKNYSNMFSAEGFSMAMQNHDLLNTYRDTIGDLFKGSEDLHTAYTNAVNRAYREHNNPYSKFWDADGNEVSFGSEGWAGTAVNGNYNAWTRLAPVFTAGYLARCRALEAYLVVNEDKPTFFREYDVLYVQKGLNGERFILPQAIRAGKLQGMLDLPLCEPLDKTKAPANTNVEEKTIADEGNRKIPMIKTGSSGNLMSQSVLPGTKTPIDKTKHALERQCSIDYIAVKFKAKKTDGTEEKEIEKVIHTRIERKLIEGKTSEREFNEVVPIEYIHPDEPGVVRTRYVRVVATLDLDTANYHILSDGLNEVTHIHFDTHVTNTANDMETYMTGQDKFNYSFDVENKIYGSIPIIPEMTADYNAGGEGVSWVAYMSDLMTESYSGMRDIDLENNIEENYQYKVTDGGFKLNKKLGGFKFNGTYPLIPRQPGGSDDILAPQRMAFKHYLTRIFTRSEKYTNFDRNIERQWVLFANDEDVDILPDVQWTSSSAETNPNGEGGTSNFRYGWSLDDAYGWMDNFGRKARVIGSKDPRWLGRPIWAVLKSLTIAAPTTIYMPFSFRVFNSNTQEFLTRPSLLFASRDAKRVATLVQARITLEGNDLNLYANSAAFAAGFKGTGSGVYNPLWDANAKNISQESVEHTVVSENIPPYVGTDASGNAEYKE